MNTKFRIDHTPIVNILTKKELLIPVYQRSYKWKDEHVDALIDDLIGRTNDKSEHFFGVIALSSETISNDGNDIVISKVIDGQQRLTTSLLLYIWLARNVKDLDDDVATQILCKKKEIKFKHEMSESSLKDNVKNLIDELYNLLKGQFKTNWIKINERLTGLSPDYIKKMFNTFKEKFIVATISYEIDKNEEMLVFENLNSKGSPLAPFDLIRNYIISMSTNNPQENLKHFNKHIMNLSQTQYKSIGNPTKAEKAYERFMEFYTIFKKSSSLKSYTNYSVYKNFKQQFIFNNISPDEYDKFLYEMRKYAILYFDMETKQGIGENIWLKTLSNKDNHYFFIFSLFEKYGEFDNDHESWIMNSTIENYIKVIAQHVLKVISVEGTGQSWTNMYINIMNELKEHNITAKQLKTMLERGQIKGGKISPSDGDFKESLLQKPKAKWIPYAIIDILEHVANVRNSANEIVNYNQKSVEHILPQKAKEVDWPFIVNNSEEYLKTVNQIGNLVNFDKSANSSLGNKPFIKKLNKYRQSSSPLITGKDLNVKPLTNLTTFTFEDIKERTEKLANELITEFNLLKK